MTVDNQDNETGSAAPGPGNSLSDRVIESLNQPLIVVDSSMRIFLCNRQFAEIFGVEACGTGQEPLSNVIQDERLEATIRSTLSAGTTSSEVEFTFRGDGGEERHFLLAISPIHAPVLDDGALVVFDEITEWKTRQHQVMEASRLVSIGEMAAGIAHEINNPLAAAMGFAQLLLRRELEPSAEADVKKILGEATRAAKIIGNLQSFARRFRPIKSTVDVAQTVQKVLDFRAYELEVNNITVVTNFEPGLPPIEADQQQIEHVFMNLVTNAEQFMAAAHSGGTLKIGVVKSGGNIRMTFADDGPGIPRENLSRVFDPFFTTKEVGGGTGLGLSVCYGMIHEHGGMLTAESTPGQGATFTVMLPAMEEAPRSSLETTGATSTPSMSILIVDDEPAVAEFLSRALEEFGHNVNVARNGDEAMRNRKLEEFDLVILDVKMPGAGGVAVYEHIARMQSGNTPEVLFITGDATNAATRRFVDESGSSLLAKPFTLEDLSSSVARVAMHRRRRRGTN